MTKNTEAIFQALTESFGPGVFNENVKRQILDRVGSKNDPDAVYAEAEKALGKDVFRDSTRNNVFKRADAILRGDAKKVPPAPEVATKEEKQKAGTITDTGEDKDVGALMHEGFNVNNPGTDGNRTTSDAAARSQISAATNTGSVGVNSPGAGNL